MAQKMSENAWTVFSRSIDIALICALTIGQLYISQRLLVYYRMPDARRLEIEARQLEAEEARPTPRRSDADR